MEKNRETNWLKHLMNLLLGVDVNHFLSSLTEINSTLSCHIVLILDQVYAGHFSETLNLVLDHFSRGFWAFVDWLEVSDFQLRLLREVSTKMFSTQNKIMKSFLLSL